MSEDIEDLPKTNLRGKPVFGWLSMTFDLGTALESADFDDTVDDDVARKTDAEFERWFIVYHNKT